MFRDANENAFFYSAPFLPTNSVNDPKVTTPFLTFSIDNKKKGH
jgi:hypothetical protein